MDPITTTALVSLLVVTISNLILDLAKTIKKSTCCGGSVIFKDDSQPNPTDLGPVE